MTVALAMIVRDEAENIIRCLNAAKPFVDVVVLDDTGSVDGTPQIAREWGERNAVPVSLREWEWQNFRENRTALVRRASGLADWLLMLDADMVIHAPDPLVLGGAVDCWHGRIAFTSLSYTLPFLVRSSKPWYYEGVAHSYLACREPYDEGEMQELWVEDYSHTSVAKLERDLVALSTEHAKHPLDRRTVFYLAQTYYDLDRFQEAIHYYRMRANMGGWDEEVYFARYRLGCLLSEHVDFRDGARELLRAWDQRPSRAEVLRVLANVANNVADKIPLSTDRLFVTPSAYAQAAAPTPPPGTQPALTPAPPPFPNIAPARLRRRPRVTARKGLDPRDVSAVIVTRGNVDLGPVVDTLDWCGEIVVWDNSKRDRDYKAFGRYAAIPETTNPVIFWVDDDVIFTAWEPLLAAYEPGRLVCNMDAAWIDGAGYRGRCGMQGAGSLCDAAVPARVWDQYLAAHPWDDDALVEADFVFGTLVPFTVVDLGYETRDFADGPDRLYTQPGQTARKHEMIDRCLSLLSASEAA